MTCIVAVTDGATVWMGGDSATLYPGTYDLDAKRDPKVFHLGNGQILMGVAGATRLADLAQWRLELGEIPQAYDRRFVMDLAERLRELAAEYGHLSNDKPASVESIAIVGWLGHIFWISGEFAVTELAGYSAIGCGEQIAKGALYATQGIGMLPYERVGLALEAAEAHSGGVRGPFTILETKP